MRTRILPAVLTILAVGAALTLAACVQAAAPAEKYPSYSGVYPHLAATNNHKNEVGIGAVVPWADKLWYVTYPAHVFSGGSDKLHEIDAGLNMTLRPESVGGTHANRMIHRESNQLIIGPYFIDSKGTVRAISQAVMPGRHTATARHLTDPANKVYMATMEQGFYEVDVRTLDVKLLHKDRNVGGKNMLPGVHGKGCYSGQGRVVYANNGVGGLLAEWNGKGDIGDLASWTIIDRNKYTDITGPGGILGAPDDAAPLWAIGWDNKSVLLNVCDAGKWTRFRLPKASYTQDADHGWFTEWPRIREVTGGHLLMNKHDMFYDFPKDFRPGRTAGIRPVSTFVKMTVDYTDWNGRLVLAFDDASCQGQSLLGQPQSNLWFGSWDELKTFGTPAGWGGPWLKDEVKAGQPSEPFLLAGFQRRIVHLMHNADEAVTFTFETDDGSGKWTECGSVTVPAKGYVPHLLPADIKGEWIRLKTDRDVAQATAYFHYTARARAAEPALFTSLAAAEQTGRRSEGLLYAPADEAMPLQFAATVVDESGKAAETGFYVMGVDMKLRRTDDAAADKTVRTKAATKQDFEVDAASVIVKEKKGRYRLPRGPEALTVASAAGWPRGIREIITERLMMDVAGTLYELPREASGGLARIRPITTHNRRIFDFASWRGLLVLSGNLVGTSADGHTITSDDGKVAVWVGNAEDLWKLGPPRGEGGPWRDADVKADAPSDPYLMTGYDRKSVRLSHDAKADVKVTLEYDFTGGGHFHTGETVTVPAGKTLTHEFPAGFSAHWVRVKSDTACKATAWFVYDVAE